MGFRVASDAAVRKELVRVLLEIINYVLRKEIC